MNKIGLKSVWEKFPVNFTHIHTDFTSTSTIDHFLVNERLLDLIEDAGALHLGDNLSRHSPIMMKLNIGNIPLQRMQNPPKVMKRPAWYKATTEEILQYTQTLHDKVMDLPIPPSSSCRNVHCDDDIHKPDIDSHCVDILCAMIESSHVSIPMSSSRSRPANSSNKIGANIPGWREQVEPFRKDSLFWHGVWLSAGRPQSGELKRIMVTCRSRYHYAVRKAKANANQILACKFLEASERGEMDLLKEMKNIRGSKNKGQSMPENLEGKT